MSSEGEFISSYVEDLDSEEAREALTISKIVHGALFAGITSTTPPLSDIIKIVDHDIAVDEHGNYGDYFTIVTAAGHRIRVQVTPES